MLNSTSPKLRRTGKLLIILLFAAKSLHAMESNNNNGGQEISLQRRYDFSTDLATDMWKEIIEQLIKSSNNVPDVCRLLSRLMRTCKKLNFYTNNFARHALCSKLFAIVEKINKGVKSEKKKIQYNPEDIKKQLLNKDKALLNQEYLQYLFTRNSYDIFANALNNKNDDLAIAMADNQISTIHLPFISSGHKCFKAIAYMANKIIDEIEFFITKPQAQEKEIYLDIYRARLPQNALNNLRLDNLDAKRCNSEEIKKVVQRLKNILLQSAEKFLKLPLCDILSSKCYPPLYTYWYFVRDLLEAIKTLNCIPSDQPINLTGFEIYDKDKQNQYIEFINLVAQLKYSDNKWQMGEENAQKLRRLKCLQFQRNHKEENLQESNNPICQFLINGGQRHELDKILSEKREFINQEDSQGNLPIFIALKLWDDIAVRMIIAKGANLFLKNQLDESLLMNAIKLNELDLTESLIENSDKLKINLDYYNTFGFSALDYAQGFLGADHEITKLLESKLKMKEQLALAKYSANNKDRTDVWPIAKNIMQKIFEYFIGTQDEYFEPSIGKKANILRQVSKKCDALAINSLFNNLQLIDDRKNKFPTKAHLAVALKSQSMLKNVKHLSELETNTSPNKLTPKGLTSLMSAIYNLRNEDLKFIESLIDKGADANESSAVSVLIPSRISNLWIPKEEKLGIKRQVSPLMFALAMGKVEIFKLLLQKGASINYINAYGQTIFEFAVELENKMNGYLTRFENGQTDEFPEYLKDRNVKIFLAHMQEYLNQIKDMVDYLKEYTFNNNSKKQESDVFIEELIGNNFSSENSNNPDKNCTIS